MVGAVAIRLKDPMFESQTKNKLGNTEIRTELVNNVRRGVAALFPTQQTDRRDDRGEGEGHAGVAEGIAEREKARARTRQGDHVAHPAVEGLQESFRQEKGKGQGHDGVHLRRPVRRRLDHELSRREQSGCVRAQGQAAQRLGSQARRDVQERRDVQPHAARSTSRTTPRACVTTRSSSPPTRTWTACTSAT
jgi:hypothetical protein